MLRRLLEQCVFVHVGLRLCGKSDVPPAALSSTPSHAQWDTPPPHAAGPAGKYHVYECVSLRECVHCPSYINTSIPSCL